MKIVWTNKKIILIIVCVIIDLLFIYFGISRLNRHQEDCWLHEPSLYDYYSGMEMDNPYLSSGSAVYCESEPLISGVYDVTVSYKTESKSFQVSCSSTVKRQPPPLKFSAWMLPFSSVRKRLTKASPRPLPSSLWELSAR